MKDSVLLFLFDFPYNLVDYNIGIFNYAQTKGG